MRSSIQALILLASLLFTATTQAQNLDNNQHETQIRAVVEDFRTSIIAKDKTRFLALFHGMSIPWLAVYEDKSLAKIRERKADFPKADPLNTPGPDQFIDFIVKEQQRLEEKFRNVRIQTDGQIANVYFDYSFHQGDYMTNFGKEAWQLVNTDHGWKINSVIYSVELNPQPPVKSN